MLIFWGLEGATMKKRVPNLKHTAVWRGGSTSRYINRETANVALKIAEYMQLTFSMASKGGGRTRVCLRIEPKDFGALASAMAAVDRQAAMLAFTRELNRQVTAQPEWKAEITRSAYEAIENLAHQKYLHAPVEDDEKEKLVSTEVKKLVGELQRPGSRSRRAAAAP